MAYTALDKMYRYNLERFGRGIGPLQPELHAQEDGACGLKSAALAFIHDECEGLCFSAEKEAQEEREGVLLGTGTAPGQIPYNMQMDVNRLCLERELERFIDSGVAEDAYNVYYAYMKMFFGEYGKSKKMVELLSEFESNGSSLLMKHRDHYSHSVYVFALGLAIYGTNSVYRKAFRSFYGYSGDENDAEQTHLAANAFLEYWGLASLFHDIGYPFELPFEQVLSYFEVAGRMRGRESMYMAYHDAEMLTALSAQEREHFRELTGKDLTSTDELFAHDITEKLGETYHIDEQKLIAVLGRKPVDPEYFGYYMDHAWFSAARLYQEMKTSVGIDKIGRKHIDALTAILLHNSLFKYSIAFIKDSEKAGPPLPMDLHPLAWMLMFCDELQCWDRIAYGRNSRTELHPMKAEFDLSGDAVSAVYYYDSDEEDKISAYYSDYDDWAQGRTDGKPRLKAYSDMTGEEPDFIRDLCRTIDMTNIPLTLQVGTCPADRSSKHTYLSDSNFLHLYDFAVSLNGRYAHMDHEDEVPAEQLEEEFGSLSLEYQLSNINQAKSFSRYLDEIDCFYTDRPVTYRMITAFTGEQTGVFAPMEHERWVLEHISMGWGSGDEAETLPVGDTDDEASARRALREQLRFHKLAMTGSPTSEEIYRHYDMLPEAEQDKDWKPFTSMLKLIKKFDGLRIYRLDT